jgi:3-(3-hydroxy-phenyl)propionate hydroxylase
LSGLYFHYVIPSVTPSVTPSVIPSEARDLHLVAHPLVGRRMPDLDLVTRDGQMRLFTFLHHARPLLINFGEPGAIAIEPWRDRVQLVDASYEGAWALPVIGPVSAPGAVLIRPDGYVAWAGDEAQHGLVEALETWFGPPAAR